MKRNCYNCAYALKKALVDCLDSEQYAIVECMNRASGIKNVEHPEVECTYCFLINNDLNGKDVFLTLSEKDYFRKSAHVLANMVLDSDHSYDYKRGFIDAFGEMTIALMSKDDEKE